MERLRDALKCAEILAIPLDQSPSAQMNKGQGKCELEYGQVQQCYQMTSTHQTGLAQSAQMHVDQNNTPCYEHATLSFTYGYQAIGNPQLPDRDMRRLGKCAPLIVEYGQATEGQEFPNWDSCETAKYETCKSINFSPEEKARIGGATKVVTNTVVRR